MSKAIDDFLAAAVARYNAAGAAGRHAAAPRRGLTGTQRGVLRFVAERQLAGVGCTLREIGEAFGIGSLNGVVCHLEALERKGYLARDANHARSIRLAGCRLVREYTDDEAGARLRKALEGGDDRG